MKFDLLYTHSTLCLVQQPYKCIMIPKKLFKQEQVNFDYILEYILCFLRKDFKASLASKNRKLKFKAFEMNHPIYTEEYVYFNVYVEKNNTFDVVLSQHHQEVAKFGFGIEETSEFKLHSIC